MFTRKLLIPLVLLVGIGGARVAGIVKSQTAPLSPSEAKRTQCELHKVALETDVVPIIYGDVGFADGYLQAQRQFPNARSSALGGCIVSPTSPKQQTVKFCPQCREAEKKWRQEHKPK